MEKKGHLDEARRKRLEKYVAYALGVLPALSHSKTGWGDLYNHCLIEAARARAFADVLGFDKGLTKDLILASLFHDGNKRLEIAAIQEAATSGESTRNASNTVTKRYLEELAEKGISRRVIRFISLVGGAPNVLLEITKILEKKSLSAEEVATLVAHYIDDYTTGGEWATPAAHMPDGTFINDIDRRMEKNRNNPNYKEIDAEDLRTLQDLQIFSGKSSFETMAVVSHEVEKKLVSLVRSWTGISHFRIPEIIDDRIREWLSAAA